MNPTEKIQVKKIVLSAAIAGLLAAPALAQNFGHFPSNTPTTGGGNSWPMNFSSTTGRFIQILNPLASDLPTGTPLKITDVALAPTSSTQFVCSADFQLRMSHLNTMSTFNTTSTVTTTPSATYAAELGPVPTNLINRVSGITWGGAASTWNDFGLDSHFGWDGQSAIVLEIRYRGQNTAGGSSCHSDPGIARVWSNTTSADNFVATTGSPSSSSGLKTRLTYTTSHVCVAPETAKLGTPSPIFLTGFTPGGTYILAASLGQTPFPLPATPSCTIALDLDGVFQASQTVGAPLFTNYAGQVAANGSATPLFQPPNFPVLVGVKVYHAAVGINGSIVSCSNTSGTQLAP